MILGGIFAFIVFLLRVRIPESILWLTYQGKFATTKQLLRRTYRIDLPDVPGVDVELRRVARGLRSAFLSSFDFYPFVWFLPYILLTLKLTGL